MLLFVSRIEASGAMGSRSCSILFRAIQPSAIHIDNVQ
jgi:hypothetical protein